MRARLDEDWPTSLLNPSASMRARLDEAWPMCSQLHLPVTYYFFVRGVVRDVGALGCLAGV
jgi:hypothetical protein